jgi:tRNA modification GTPase TrmE
MKSDTIAAIATGMSNSGIGIVRISGEDSFSLIDKIYRSKNENKKLSDQKSHTVHYGHIVDGENIIDEVLVVIMRAPNSYTREDTVEINTHGGILVMQRILETVIKYGASPAEPGEFTKRAFLNGRIDLSQAESVIDIIQAKNDFALKNSVSQLRGSIHDKIKEIRSCILNEVAFVESALDDPEHYDLDGYQTKLQNIVENLLYDINGLLDSFQDGKILSEGINTVIVGKPNAGKSSFLNTLVGEEKAIVTDIAGTTRDVLEEHIMIGGISLNIMDTAGIRDTDNVVEKIGVEKAKRHLTESDLIIYIADSSSKLDENDELIMEELKDRKAVCLLNKSDLDFVTTKEDILNKLNLPVILISAKNNTGIDEFKDWLKSMFFQGKLEFNDEVYITNIRHKTALEKAKESMIIVLDSIESNVPEDFLVIDLMEAYQQLGFIIGESVDEDLVNEIFSKFCMGK